MSIQEKKNMENKMSYYQKSRFYKVYQEQFFLLNIEKYPENFKIDVSGSSKNIYSIYIYENTRKIKCNCPDMKSWASYNRCVCKHCCFLLFRVLKLWELGDFFENLEFSEELFPEIMIKLFILLNKLNNINHDDDAPLLKEITNKDILDKYNKILEKKEEKKEEIDNKYNSKKVINDDLCPICFIDFIKDDILLDCPECKKSIHKSCMEKWLSLGKNQCVYCRSNVWKDYCKDGEINEYKNLDD